MRYRFLPFPLFQTRPKRNGVKTGHASCPPKFLNCASFREVFDCYRTRHPVGRCLARFSFHGRCNKRLTFSVGVPPSSEAWTDPGSAVAVSAATAAAAVRALSAIGSSFVCVFSPPPSFLVPLRFVVF